MKIFLIGSNQEWSIERYYVKYLTNEGVKIKHFALPDLVDRKRNQSFLFKLLLRIGFNFPYRSLNVLLINEVEAFKPDIIWVFKGMEILPGTLVYLRGKYKLVNYNPDHPFILSSRGSGNANVTNGVKHYHLHLCYNRALMQKINSEFGINVAELPFAYELNESLFTEIEQTAQEVNKICFLGNPDKIRIKVLQNIVDNGFEVHIYGNGWNETTLALHKNVSLNPAVYKAQMWRVLRKYRVQLNIFRLHNQGSHNMRSFEVPAIGGILLTQYSDEQADFFAINKEIFTYSDNTELLSQLKYLLGLTQSQALAIRNAARQRSLTGGYSYMHRALQVLDLMKTLLN